MPDPFFILGTQRSGTTLLCRMLNMHPRLYCLNELAEGEGIAPLWHLYERLRRRPEDPERLADLLAARLGLERPYAGGADTRAWTVLAHVAAALEAKAGELGKPRWGLKDPRLTYALVPFLTRFPRARFIVLVRDPRGVCHSYLRQRENVANVYHGARLWRAEIARQQAFMRAHPENAHRVRYEDLLAQPEWTLRAICAFLGEDYTAELLRYPEHPPEFPVHAPNANVTRAPDPSLAHQWREGLGRRQTAVIEAVAGEALEALGYAHAVEPRHPGALARLGYAVHQWVMTNYWWQQRSGWHGVRRRLPRLGLGARRGVASGRP